MKTPEEIKESMQYGIDESFAIYDDESYCPGEVEVGFISVEDLEAALAYIQQLEQERIMLMDTVSKMCGKTPRWISVEDDKPKKYENVNVYVAGDDGCRYTNTGFYDGKHWRGYGNRFDVVTHWTPLPEPPVEERE